ncbi:4-alpha-glucanotransferase [Mariniluteicoccus endophyticus]
MTAPSPELVELAHAFDIATEFVDWKGRTTHVSTESLVAVLAALDVDASSPEAARAALDDRRTAPWRRVLPPCVVCDDTEEPEFVVHVPAGEGVRVHVVTEDGVRHDAVQVDNWEPDREVDGVMVGEASFQLPAGLPLGYHHLVAEVAGVEHTSTLIVTPHFLGFPDGMGDRRIWGLAAQLYSVRSHDSWGVGDLTDLRDLAVWSAAEHGADYVLVNPMHAAEPDAPMEPSPYLPTTRRFFNPLYLRVERIEEYASAPAPVRHLIDQLADQAHGQLDAVDFIDRNASWTLKQRALRALYAVPRSPGREIAFGAYCEGAGEGLLNHATWAALTAALGADWTQWPDDYQTPAAPAVARFRDENADEVDFHRWLQWCLDDQLRGAQTAAQASGMALGIVHDLAVGVNPRGSDGWSLGSAFARGVHVGAPPDQFTQLGQDWGQPPLRPDRLPELAYAPFRDMVRTILRHSGGVRVDHIIGLFRLWWVPEGMKPTEGTYVRYDHRAMIGVLALEAQRAGALVVGEDLGTVEPWVRDYLTMRGILGTSILWFEQDWDVPGGQPLRPDQWREMCLASVTTHDLPPTAGYLDGVHVELRHRLGLLADDLADELARDEADRRQWLQFLVELGLLESVDAPNTRVVEALHAFLLRTPSRMLNLALVDAVGDRRTQNQPGTSNEYPNWRVPLAGPDGTLMWLEDVFASERARSLSALMGRVARS